MRISLKFTVATLVASTIVSLASAQTARWKIAPEYNSITIISKSLLKVEKEGLFGLVDIEGKTIVPCQYEQITDIIEDRCLIFTSNYRLQAISDGAGNLVKEFGSEEIWYVDSDYPNYSEGLLAVCNNNGRWTYLDKSGSSITKKAEFKGAAPFINGYAVVRYKDNSYIHINKRGEISKLDSQFKNNFLIYASSFTTERSDNGESLVSVIVDSNNNVFLRDRSGKKVGSLGIVTDWDKISRKMTTDEYVILFESNRQIHSITPKNKGVAKTYNPQTPELYQPPISALTSEKEDNHYKLLFEGQELLPAQFDKPLIALSATEIIASQNGRYGVLTIDNEYSPCLSLSQCDLTYDHHVPVRVQADISVIPELSESRYHVVITNKDNVLFDGAPEEGSVSFDFLPDELSSSGTENFEISTEIDGIVHPDYSLSEPFTYENPFSINFPGRVKLNKSNTTGTVSITIVNETSSASDICDILADGNVVRKGVCFQGNESVSIPISKSVDIQDLDEVSKLISIQIKENGCPVYKVSRKVIFERNL